MIKKTFYFDCIGVIFVCYYTKSSYVFKRSTHTYFLVDMYRLSSYSALYPRPKQQPWFNCDIHHEIPYFLDQVLPLNSCCPRIHVNAARIASVSEIVATLE